MSGWTCARCDLPLDAHHEWHGCSFPEPGMETTSPLHAIVIHGTPDDPMTLVLHPPDCQNHRCPIATELDEVGHDCLPLNIDTGLPVTGVYLVQQWSVAGTRSPFALAPLEWDSHTLVHAFAPLDDVQLERLADVDELGGQPWQ